MPPEGRLATPSVSAAPIGKFVECATNEDVQSLSVDGILAEGGAETEPEPCALPAVECWNLARRFGDVTALDGVSLTVYRGEFFSLLGPSGCGKTTLLRLLAGLDAPNSGYIRLLGVDMTGVPPQQRPVNTVFQSYALFPHLTVYENVAFGLRMKRLPEPMVERKVREALALTRIHGLEQRKPAELSGGQQQRVALARALVNEPAVLLLDEPLGALDVHLRKQLQTELRQMQRRLGLTFIHVTHDQEEAFTLSDRIAVMRAGRIEQVGTPRQLYEQPRTRFVAQFLGHCNLIDGTAVGWSADRLLVQTALGLMEVAWTGSASPTLPVAADRRPPPTRGQQLTLAVRPERIRMRPDQGAGLGVNTFRAVVEEALYLGASIEYRLRSAGQLLTVLEGRNGHETVPYATGEQVLCAFSPTALTLLDD